MGPASNITGWEHGDAVGMGGHVTSDARRDEGTLAGLPWASVLDPAANARALDELRRQGLAAAGEIIDRLTRSVDPDHRTAAEPAEGPAASTAAGTAGDTSGKPGVRDLDRLVGRCAALLARATGTGDPVAADEVVIAVDGTGPAAADVWFHNTSDRTVAGGQLRCTSLVSHDGRALRSESVRFEPASAPSIGPDASASVRIVVEIPTELSTTPTVLRGALVVEGHPELWLPVTVTTGSA